MVVRVLAKLQSRPPHTGRVALNLTLIGLGWLLAAASGMLWLRKYPGRRIGRGYPETQRGRPLDVLGLAGFPLGAYGGTGLQVRYDWGWWVVPAVLVPPASCCSTQSRISAVILTPRPAARARPVPRIFCSLASCGLAARCGKGRCRMAGQPGPGSGAVVRQAECPNLSCQRLRGNRRSKL